MSDNTEVLQYLISYLLISYITNKERRKLQLYGNTRFGNNANITNCVRL